MKQKKPIIFIFLILISIVSVTTLVGCDLVNTSGLSAYEIAVKHGFEGSEEEWLESLKGENGINGINGEDGNDRTVTIQQLYNEATANGYTKSYLEFLNEYLSKDTSPQISYTTNIALQSAVIVSAKFKYDKMNIFQEVTGEGVAVSSGSGIIYKLDKVKGDCYIITNYHVVYMQQGKTVDHVSDDISIQLYGRKYDPKGAVNSILAKYVGGSLNYDIAVLKVEGSEVLKNAPVKSVDIASSEQQVGSTVIAVGNPSSGGLSATFGILSVDSENIRGVGADDKTPVVMRVMRIDAAVNSGNSGGGLFNNKGEVIGIVNAKVVSKEIENIAYAIPINVAVSVAENIMATKKPNQDGVQKCMLGITVEIVDSEAEYDTVTQSLRIVQKVGVKEVTENSLGEKLGIVAGDILLSISLNEQEEFVFNRQYQVVDYMLDARVGDNVKIKYQRGEEIKINSIQIAETDVTNFK